MIHFAKEEDNRLLYGCDILEDIIEFWESCYETRLAPTSRRGMLDTRKIQGVKKGETKCVEMFYWMCGFL